MIASIIFLINTLQKANEANLMIPFKKVSISVIAAIAEGFQGEIVGRNIAVVDSCAVDFSVEVSNGEVNKGDG